MPTPSSLSLSDRLGIILAYMLVVLFLAALVVKLNATSDDSHDQAVLSAILIVLLLVGPLANVVEIYSDMSAVSSFAAR